MANNIMNFGTDLLPTTDNTFSLGSSNKKWIINGIINPKLTDTTYTEASSNQAGLMSINDKNKLDNLSNDANDLTQASGDYLIFNCGSATVLIDNFTTGG